MLVGGNRTQIEVGVCPACTISWRVIWGELLYFSPIKWEDSFLLASEWGVPGSHTSAGSSPRHQKDTCRAPGDTAVPVEPGQPLGRADLGVSSGE